MKNSKNILMYPNLVKMWDYNKNIILPEQVTIGSHKEIYWKCINNHYFQECPKNIVRNMIKNKMLNLCPICTNNNKMEKNALVYRRPDLLKSWDYSLNNEDPLKLLFKSRKEINWICENGHKWKCALYIRSRGGECPYCLNRRISSENNLLFKFPEIAKEWDYSKNSIHPDIVIYSSEKKYWWICKKGHQWRSSVCSRTLKNTGCPYCAGQKVCKDNCLSTLNPELIKEWDVENKILPTEVTCHSAKKIIWKCSYGHKWITTVYNRVGGNGCPYCSKKIHLKDGKCFSSLVEAYVYLKFKSRKYKMELDKRYGFGKYRFDFYLPDFNTYIEATGFTNENCTYGYAKNFWPFYYEKIQKKKKYVENILKAKFRFIQIKLNKSQKLIVRRNV